MNIRGRTYTIAPGRCKLCRKDKLVAWSGFLSEPRICERCLLKKCTLTEDEAQDTITAFRHAETPPLDLGRMVLQWSVTSTHPVKLALGWSSGGPLQRIIATVYQWTGDDPQWGWKIDLPRYRLGGFSPEKETSMAQVKEAIREFYRWQEPI